MEDLVALSDAAWWLGLTDETLALAELIYRLHLREGRVPQAARAAMDIGFLSFIRGDVAIGSGWIGRARRLVRDEPECVESGYLLTIEVDEALAGGDFEGAIASAHQVQEIANLYRDPTLNALGLVGEGIALTKQGHIAKRLAVLDEAMLPVSAGDVEPSIAGNIYCQLMAVWHDLADLPRARQWTEATERWCAGFPSAVMFLGICRVHRAQLFQAQGQWAEAEQYAVRACEELATMNVAVVGEGRYQIGEINRLRGDFAAAEVAYRSGHELGRDPQPGLALLRLAEGRVDVAVQGIRALLAGGAGDNLTRAPLLAAQVEIALAADDLDGALAACQELQQIAEIYRTVARDLTPAEWPDRSRGRSPRPGRHGCEQP